MLSLPPVLMEKYLSAAETVSRTAIFGAAPMKPMLEKLSPRSRKINPSPLVPAAYDVTGLSLANAFHAEHRVPVEADYVIHAVAGGTRPAGSDPIQLTLWIDGAVVESKVLDPEALASFSDDQQDFLSKGVEFTVHLKPGTHWLAVAIPHLYEGLPTTYNGPNPSARPIPPPPVFKPWPDATPEQIEKARKHFEEEHKDTPPGEQRARVVPRAQRALQAGDHALTRGLQADLHLRSSARTSPGRRARSRSSRASRPARSGVP